MGKSGTKQMDEDGRGHPEGLSGGFTRHRRCWGQEPQGQPEPRVVPALGAVGRMGFRGYWVTGTMLLNELHLGFSP